MSTRTRSLSGHFSLIISTRRTSAKAVRVFGNPAIPPIGMPPMPESPPAMMRDSALMLAGDDHWDAGCVYHGGADRSEQHSGESAPAESATERIRN
jgi:hypothetical protein